MRLATSFIVVLLVSVCLSREGRCQRLSVDSLEHNGYRVKIYKPQPVRLRTVVREIHDTLRETIVRIVVIRDTVVRERIALCERVTEHIVNLPPIVQERFSLMLVGNANTNGYGMHFGGQLQLGDHIAFFIGCGMGYNSVTKVTHLDLAGLLLIRL